MAYGKPFEMPSAYTTPPCEYVTEVRLNKERKEEEGRMSGIATFRVKLDEEQMEELLADMRGIVETRDELLLAVADYVLDTYQPTRAEKAERTRELMEKVRA